MASPALFDPSKDTPTYSVPESGSGTAQSRGSVFSGANPIDNPHAFRRRSFTETVKEMVFGDEVPLKKVFADTYDYCMVFPMEEPGNLSVQTDVMKHCSELFCIIFC